MWSPDMGLRLALATDAWAPQVNGVVRTLQTTVRLVQDQGHEVMLLTPNQFRTVALPGYREIRLAMAPRFGTRRRLNAFRPDLVHIATEGPIGWAARNWCRAHRVPYTSAFHTRFPEYASMRTGLDPRWFWPIMRRFHSQSSAVLVSTPRLMQELADHGLKRGRLWSRGIDGSLFHPGHVPLPQLADLPGPVMLYVGRVAVEKNLAAFLEAPVAGSKVVVGDGPDLVALRERFPQAIFTGGLAGPLLAAAYCAADVFVFPSRTDTFGLVMIEAMACGVPVAAFPVPGPLDVVGAGGLGADGNLKQPVGALDEDLAAAITRALTCDRAAAAAYGASYTWEAATNQFLDAIGAAAHAGLAEAA